MHFDLLLPELFWQPALVTPPEAPRLPALERLLGRARPGRAPADSPEAWLCGAFAVDRQSDWPSAPLCALADGLAPGQEFWLRADPVYLEVKLNQVVLAEGAARTLTRSEADELVAVLNRHFAAGGLHITAPRPDRWYLHAAEAPQITTRSLFEVTGKNINNFFPSGPDGLRWTGIINEVQMLFHETPVNQEREARGLPAINSVWFWGGGALPTPRTSYAAVCAGDPLARGLALACGIPIAEAEQVLDPDRGPVLAVASELQLAAATGHPDYWVQALQALEQAWFAPLLDALTSGRLKSLAIHVPTAAGCRTYFVRRGDLRKFWRRPRPLSHYTAQPG